MKISLTLIAMFGLACGVPADEHIAVQKDLDEMKVRLAKTQVEAEKRESNLTARVSELEQVVDSLRSEQLRLEEQLENERATLSMYESKTGGLQKALAATKAELNILRENRVRRERLRVEHRQLAKRLHAMINAGSVALETRDDAVVVVLDQGVLFEADGKTVAEQGKVMLAELAAVLKGLGDRKFVVTGVSGASGRAQSSRWTLRVANALQDAGIEPARLSTHTALGADNRIEIVIRVNRKRSTRDEG